MKRKPKALPLFDRPKLPERLYECAIGSCEESFFGAEWEARCAGWSELRNEFQDHWFAVCPGCSDQEKRIDAEGRDVTDLPGLWDESDKRE